MPTIAWKQALREAISEVCATMFFMVPEPNPEAAENLASLAVTGWSLGQIELSQGEQRVRVFIGAPGEINRELAENLLAVEGGDLSDEDLADAFREMVNMVAGRVLTRVDDENRWVLGLPQSQRLPGGDAQTLLADKSGSLVLDLDGRPLLAAWREE